MRSVAVTLLTVGIVVSSCDGEDPPLDPRVTFDVPCGGHVAATDCVLSPGPDADGDGIGDLLLGAPSAAEGGEVHLYSGSSGSRLRTWDLSDVAAIAADARTIGSAVSLGPDADADGLADVLIRASSTNADDGLLLSLWSGDSGALLASWRIGRGSFNPMSLGPDVDGDGRGDVLVGIPEPVASEEPGRVVLYSGATGEELRRWTDPRSAAAVGSFGRRATLGSDINGDDRADVTIGDDTYSSGTFTSSGAAYVHSGADGDLLHRIDGQWPYAALSETQIGPDVDGDGRADLLAVSRDGARKEAALYSGESGLMLRSTHDGTIDVSLSTVTYSFGPDADNDGFGDVLSRSWVLGWVVEVGPDIPKETQLRLSSGASGAAVKTWTATFDDGLFIVSGSLGPDSNGDGLADVVAIVQEFETRELDVNVLRSSVNIFFSDPF